LLTLSCPQEKGLKVGQYMGSILPQLNWILKIINLHARVFWTSLNFIAVLYAENLTELNSVMFLKRVTMSG